MGCRNRGLRSIRFHILFAFLGDSICVLIIIWILADATLSQVVLEVFTRTVHAEDIIIYPELCQRGEYEYNGTSVLAKEISDDGIRVNKLKDNCCQTIRLCRK